MLKFVGWILKIAAFSVIVLILGSALHWRGRTISDEVKTQLAHAERSDVVTGVTDWASKVSSDTRGAVSRHADHLRRMGSNAISDVRAKAEDGEKIPESERQKLRALIQDLNRSHGRD